MPVERINLGIMTFRSLVIRFFVVSSLVSIAVIAEGGAHFTGDFESGKVLPIESQVDGFRIRTLPEPQRGKEIEVISAGGADAKAALDTRVVSEDKVAKSGNGGGSEVVKPRKGKYFLRSVLYKHKNYSELQGGRDKPRSGINVSGDSNSVDFDEEGYLGFSVYLPKNLEHETAWDGSRGSTKVLQVQSNGASHILMILSVYVPKGKKESHWLVEHLLNDGRSSKKEYYDLGPVSGDLGKWTDFVMRYRFNPFSKKTKASSVGGKARVYEGNKGILQLWKANGEADNSGNREMKLTKLNLVNRPVGRVPHKTSKINWHFRIYKGNWKKKPTSMKGPIWIGFDEIRDGRVARHGTTYADVHPGGLACTDRCPTGSTRSQHFNGDGAPPRPPERLTVME